MGNSNMILLGLLTLVCPHTAYAASLRARRTTMRHLGHPECFLYRFPDAKDPIPIKSADEGPDHLKPGEDLYSPCQPEYGHLRTSQNGFINLKAHRRMKQYCKQKLTFTKGLISRAEVEEMRN